MSRKTVLKKILPFRYPALCAFALLLTGALHAQEAAPAEAPPQPSPEEMAAMMKAMSPGPMHEVLSYFVGDWTIEMSMLMAPGTPPVESTGSMSVESIHGGRFVKGRFQGTVMGMPFEGELLDGYDNMKQVFVSTWHDSMNTGIMTYTGSCSDEACKQRTMIGNGVDPMSGVAVQHRDVVTVIDDDTYRFESHAKVEGAEEYLAMSFTARRKKS